MNPTRSQLYDPLVSLGILLATFLVSLLLHWLLPSQSLISTVFVLGVFLVALSTRGYLWGILASLVSILIDNFAFTFPYFAFDFLSAENMITVALLLVVAILTSTLTTKLKAQERLRAETEKEKMRANLLRAISHDLRTPLTTIYGSSTVILDNYDSLSREQKTKLLGQVREDAEGLIRMVENLLSVTRINDGTVRLTKTPTVLEELIDAALLRFGKLYPRQSVTLSIPEEFISIPMDALLIQQVLVNILENAVVHAKGMTELSLTVTTEGDWAVFEIADNGSGIPRDRMEELFSGQLFSRDTPADSGRTGMGIGLSVCATIIKAHGGDIQAENRKRGGACFRFRLERENEDHEQQ